LLDSVYDGGGMRNRTKIWEMVVSAGEKAGLWWSSGVSERPAARDRDQEEDLLFATEEPDRDDDDHYDEQDEHDAL